MPFTEFRLAPEPTSAWDRFFSSLHFAEVAAAEQCELASKRFAARGESHASAYAEFAAQERRHAALARELCGALSAPLPRATAVYSGSLLSGVPDPIEPLAVIHLAFEPAALGYLGLAVNRARDLFGSRARLAKALLGDILRDETRHVAEGASFVREALSGAGPSRKRRLHAVVRRHRAFLKAGLAGFFGELPGGMELVGSLAGRYERAFRQASGKAEL